MRRHVVRPYGHSISATRTLSLLMSLAVIAMMYSWMKEPATWQWLADIDESEVAVNVPAGQVAPGSVPPVVPEVQEVIVPGPNDLDPAEFKDFKSKLELVSDGAPLRQREMSLYWRLVGWSRSDTFKKLESRADATNSYGQLWGQPSHYRGKLIRLRMHVHRILKYEAPENPLGLKDSYEIWGTTEDSLSYPYVVVVPEIPPGLKIGPKVRGEVVFVGYFLKFMGYTAFDKSRRAPLLLGRVRLVTPLAAPQPLNSPQTWLLVGGVLTAAVCGGIAIRHLLSFRKRKPTMLPTTVEGLDQFSAPRGVSLPVSAGFNTSFDEPLLEDTDS